MSRENKSSGPMSCGGQVKYVHVKTNKSNMPYIKCSQVNVIEYCVDIITCLKLYIFL
uniref:Uncharacterized protein n=1 Tax=Arion vulgaris TaxID=1028688 RepID=A0A0B7B135_9EUPU